MHPRFFSPLITVLLRCNIKKGLSSSPPLSSIYKLKIITDVDRNLLDFIYYTSPVFDSYENSILYVPSEIGLVLSPIVMYYKKLFTDMKISVMLHLPKISLLLINIISTVKIIRPFHYIFNTLTFCKITCGI